MWYHAEGEGHTQENRSHVGKIKQSWRLTRPKAAHTEPFSLEMLVRGRGGGEQWGNSWGSDTGGEGDAGMFDAWEQTISSTINHGSQKCKKKKINVCKENLFGFCPFQSTSLSSCLFNNKIYS